jgi:pimeloyl-ACP methyl ester carboxylesterase
LKVVSERIRGLHVATVTPPDCRGYFLYVHGGPGFHSAYFETAVQELPPFRDGRYGWICYDQRGCGRSVDAPGDPSHSANIDDLAALLERFADGIGGIGLSAVLGHSYGGWLAYHTLRRHPRAALPLVVVATAKDMRTAKNRSFALDMAELRIDQPDTYAKLLPELEGYDQPLWTFQRRIREVAQPLRRRADFMWGNLEARAWYEALRKRVNVPENWELTRRITENTDPAFHVEAIDPSTIPGRLLWILGVHDLLMGGDQHYPGEAGPVTTFFRSGHYPHFEEPVRFLRTLEAFLAAESP